MNIDKTFEIDRKLIERVVQSPSPQLRILLDGVSDMSREFDPVDLIEQCLVDYNLRIQRPNAAMRYK